MVIDTGTKYTSIFLNGAATNCYLSGKKILCDTTAKPTGDYLVTISGVNLVSYRIWSDNTIELVDVLSTPVLTYNIGFYYTQPGQTRSAVDSYYNEYGDRMVAVYKNKYVIRTTIDRSSNPYKYRIIVAKIVNGLFDRSFGENAVKTYESSVMDYTQYSSYSESSGVFLYAGINSSLKYTIDDNGDIVVAPIAISHKSYHSVPIISVSGKYAMVGQNDYTGSNGDMILYNIEDPSNPVQIYRGTVSGWLPMPLDLISCNDKYFQLSGAVRLISDPEEIMYNFTEQYMSYTPGFTSFTLDEVFGGIYFDPETKATKLCDALLCKKIPLLDIGSPCVQYDENLDKYIPWSRSANISTGGYYGRYTSTNGWTFISTTNKIRTIDPYNRFIRVTSLTEANALIVNNFLILSGTSSNTRYIRNSISDEFVLATDANPQYWGRSRNFNVIHTEEE